MTYIETRLDELTLQTRVVATRPIHPTVSPKSSLERSRIRPEADQGFLYNCGHGHQCVDQC